MSLTPSPPQPAARPWSPPTPRRPEEIEAHIPSRGRVLLSVDATNGDTMFFAPVKPDIAQRWHDKASSEQDVCRAGVRSPMDRFSAHTACAARGM
jgi:hypothetical protein